MNTAVFTCSSHQSIVNSYSRQKLNDKSPLDLFGFLYGHDAIEKLGLRKIPPNEIVLKPSLLKRATNVDIVCSQFTIDTPPQGHAHADAPMPQPAPFEVAAPIV